MRKIDLFLFVCVYSLFSYSYDNPEHSNTGCNSKQKLSYRWNEEKKSCEAFLKVSDKISVSNEAGVFIIEHANKEKVYSTWMNNDRKNNLKEAPYFSYLKSCPAVNTGCFVKDPANKGPKLKTTGHSKGKNEEPYSSTLEGYDSGISDEQRISFIYHGNYKCGPQPGPRLVISSEPRKEKVALTSKSFEIEEEKIDSQEKCLKLNNSKKLQEFQNRPPIKPASRQT